LYKKKGWTQGQLHVQAKRLRSTLSSSTLSEIINNKSKGSQTLDVAEAIAHALGTTVAYLIGEVDDPAPILGAGEPLPEVRAWSDRLKAMAAGQRTLAIQTIEGVLAVAEGR
jgi:transcriptional regulator with XRE-family HTH domain